MYAMGSVKKLQSLATILDGILTTSYAVHILNVTDIGIPVTEKCIAGRINISIISFRYHIIKIFSCSEPNLLKQNYDIQQSILIWILKKYIRDRCSLSYTKCIISFRIVVRIIYRPLSMQRFALSNVILLQGWIN